MAESNIIIRHILATIAYRLSKALQDSDISFLNFEAGNGVRKPGEIIYHMSAVISYCISEIEKKPLLKPFRLPDEEEKDRFFGLLQKADDLASQHEIDIETTLKLIQGPLADALTHVGQIAMLKRLFNQPIEAENFMKAPIQAGRIKDINKA